MEHSRIASCKNRDLEDRKILNLEKLEELEELIVRMRN